MKKQEIISNTVFKTITKRIDDLAKADNITTQEATQKVIMSIYDLITKDNDTKLNCDKCNKRIYLGEDNYHYCSICGTLSCQEVYCNSAITKWYNYGKEDQKLISVKYCPGCRCIYEEELENLSEEHLVLIKECAIKYGVQYTSELPNKI